MENIEKSVRRKVEKAVSPGLQPARPGDGITESILEAGQNQIREVRSMPESARKDPYKAYNFVVEIDGIIQAGFTECSGLDSKTEVIAYREGGDAGVRYLPGLARYQNIILRRGITDSKAFADWRKSTVNGEVSRRNGSIILRDDRHVEVARWNFREGWPCRISGPSLNAMLNEVAIEEIEICHEGIERV
jgi:phage tail-like protein